MVLSGYPANVQAVNIVVSWIQEYIPAVGVTYGAVLGKNEEGINTVPLLR